MHLIFFEVNVFPTGNIFLFCYIGLLAGPYLFQYMQGHLCITIFFIHFSHITRFAISEIEWYSCHPTTEYTTTDPRRPRCEYIRSSKPFLLSDFHIIYYYDMHLITVGTSTIHDLFGICYIPLNIWSKYLWRRAIYSIIRNCTLIDKNNSSVL